MIYTEKQLYDLILPMLQEIPGHRETEVAEAIVRIILEDREAIQREGGYYA